MSRQTPDASGERVARGTDPVYAPTYAVPVLGVRHPVYLSDSVEQRIAALADHQRGRVSRDQLRAAGISDRMIHRRVSAGYLIRVHRAVYAVGHTAPTPLAAETAALLACGEHAVLSHGTAARLWQLLDDDTIHVLIRGRHGAVPDGVHVHRTNKLTRAEVKVVEGLPVTSPARTLVDLGATAGRRTHERAVEEALVQRLVTERQLANAAEQAVGKSGPLKAILAANRESGVTRSKAERRFRELMHSAQLPAPQTNVRIHGYEVDAYWPDFGVVVEVQSQKFHASRAALERDTRKAAKLTAAGLTVSYVTWLQMEREPFAVVARVAQLLARAAGASAPGNPALELPLRARAGG